MRLPHFLGAALLAGATQAAHAGTYSDLWFNPQQPGWGVQVTEQVETAFITFFTYGPDGKPTWYFASNAQVVAYSGSGAYPVFDGELYRSEGTYHAQPYKSSDNRVVPVGRIQLEVLDRNRMRVFYKVGDVTGTREVSRLSIAQPIDLTNYTATLALRQVVNGQPLGTLSLQADMLVHLDPETGAAFVRTDDQLGRRCEYRGPYEVIGKLVRASGTYTCTFGDQRQGTFEITDLEATAHGVTGYLRTASGADSQFGRLAAIRW